LITQTWGQKHLEREGLPGRLVLGEDDRRLSGEILQPAHLVVDAAQGAGPAETTTRDQTVIKLVARQREAVGKDEQRRAATTRRQRRLGSDYEQQARARDDHAMIARNGGGKVLVDPGALRSRRLLASSCPSRSAPGSAGSRPAPLACRSCATNRHARHCAEVGVEALR